MLAPVKAALLLVSEAVGSAELLCAKETIIGGVDFESNGGSNGDCIARGAIVRLNSGEGCKDDGATVTIMPDKVGAGCVAIKVVGTIADMQVTVTENVVADAPGGMFAIGMCFAGCW
jgi:hypothetical protein